MPFNIQCDNKGCCKQQQPLLNVSTNEVICSECDKPILNVTDFTKRQMKQMGQISRGAKKQQAFSVKCNHCNKDGQPVLNDEKAMCAFCNKEINLSGPFLNILKNALKNATKK